MVRLVPALVVLALPVPALADAVVATQTLRPGARITAQMVAVDPAQDSAITNPEDVIGQEARVLVSKGRAIPPEALAAPTLVARNQIVTLVYRKSALRIETEGRALTAGGAGQIVRVMNNSSRATVAGRIAPDGSVIVEQN
ncbi:flagellar basal body P-ring formation chaperone FlgA [Paracoccus sp. NGMCC 1.201697]|uniref:Flagella basal body P-ring formation protein FlgA n=1 Tax=Paracoccus broussonetiae subsp. drimophilus TaxID=3373869 RepID=A0ABW7LEF4_9RHOB